MSRFREPNLDPPDEPDLSPLREKIWSALEDEGVSEETIYLVNSTISDLECCAERECPVCVERHIRELQEADKAAEEYMNNQSLP